VRSRLKERTFRVSKLAQIAPDCTGLGDRANYMRECRTWRLQKPPEGKSAARQCQQQDDQA